MAKTRAWHWDFGTFWPVIMTGWLDLAFDMNLNLDHVNVMKMSYQSGTKNASHSGLSLLSFFSRLLCLFFFLHAARNYGRRRGNWVCALLLLAVFFFPKMLCGCLPHFSIISRHSLVFVALSVLSDFCGSPSCYGGPCVRPEFWVNGYRSFIAERLFILSSKKATCAIIV